MSKAKPWTKAEDAAIRKLYPTQGTAMKLGGRTRAAIKNRAQKLGLRVPAAVARQLHAKSARYQAPQPDPTPEQIYYRRRLIDEERGRRATSASA
jgi:hypothetical protein